MTTWGTNISVIVTNVNPLVGGLVAYTNFYFTNSIFSGTMQDCEYGEYVELVGGVWYTNSVGYEYDTGTLLPGLLFSYTTNGTGVAPLPPPVFLGGTTVDTVADPANPDVETITTTTWLLQPRHPRHYPHACRHPRH